GVVQEAGARAENVGRGQDRAAPVKTGAPGVRDKAGSVRAGPENSCWPKPTSKTAYRARFATGAIHLAPTERGWTTSSTRASPPAAPAPTAAPATVSLK